MWNKEKIGKTIYFGSVILSIIILCLAMTLIPVKDGEEVLETNLNYRYTIVFVCLEFIIPIGCLTREFCNGNYVKKMLIIKAIITLVTLALGLVVILVIGNPTYSNVMTLLGALVLMYTATPTVKDNNKNV